MFMAIWYEEWDVIICAHTSFGFIEVGKAARAYIEREVSELRFYLEEMKRKKDASRSDRRSMKEIERKVLALETRLKEKSTPSSTTRPGSSPGRSWASTCCLSMRRTNLRTCRSRP